MGILKIYMNALAELLISLVTHMRGLYHFILTKIIPQDNEFIEGFRLLLQ